MKHRHPSLLHKVSNLSYESLLLLWTTFILCAAVGYYVLSVTSPANGLRLATEGSVNFFSALYFSVITATTVGYGDVTPIGFSQLIAAVQAILTYFLAGMFVTKLLGFRQEAALDQVHRLTMDALMHRMRERLYVVRRDFETAAEAVKSERELSRRTSELLSTALTECQNVLAHLPDLYDPNELFKPLDRKHEKVLLDTVLRTMERLCMLLDMLHADGISLDREPLSREPLHELLRISSEVFQNWKTLSTHRLHDEFAALEKSLLDVTSAARIR
jgi:hypothetical protein